MGTGVELGTPAWGAPRIVQARGREWCLRSAWELESSAGCHGGLGFGSGPGSGSGISDGSLGAVPRTGGWGTPGRGSRVEVER